MSNLTTSHLNVSELKPETVTTFKKMYSEKKDFLEYLSKFGNDFEKSAAALVIKIGGPSAK